MLQSKILQKLKDSGSFRILCSIITKYNGRTLCDLGASINLTPLLVFKQLEVGECRSTTVTTTKESVFRDGSCDCKISCRNCHLHSPLMTLLG